MPTKSPTRSTSKRKSHSPRKIEPGDQPFFKQAASGQKQPSAAAANPQTPQRSSNQNASSEGRNIESAGKQNLLQKRTFTQISDCLSKQTKKLKGGDGKENECSGTQRELFIKSMNLDQKKLSLHFKQYEKSIKPLKTGGDVGKGAQKEAECSLK